MDSIFFVPITKVDVEKREVWGRAVQEVPDKSKEIFDYATSAPLFRDWSEGFDKATDGKSLGNIRAMHGKVAAGKVTAIDFNDKDLAIDICAKVVDDAEWNKVQEGVYTGFSIGGSYEKRWADGDLKRYTAKPAEISLVDNPCVPTARFQMIKADGVVEEKEFKAPDPAAAEVKKEEPAPVADATGEPAQVKKSMYGVASLASLLNAAATETMIAQWEAEAEQDSSPVPAALRSWLADGLKILNAMTAEESAELLATVTPAAVVVEVVELAEAKGDLAKAGARHSASDQKHVQSMHDSAVALGAGCGAGEKAAAGDLAKLFYQVNGSSLGKALIIATGAAPDENESVSAEQIEAISKFAIATAGERDELQKRVKELEAQPAPAKGVQKVIDKADDSAVVEKKVEVEDKSPLGLMKAAQSNPKIIKL